MIGAAGATALAGCSSSSGTAAEFKPIDADSIPGPDEVEDTLNAWSAYYSYRDWAVPAFAEEYGLEEANMTGYATGSEWFSKLQAGNHSIDSTGGWASLTIQCIEDDLIEPLPVDKMEGWDAMLPQYREFAKEWYSDDEGRVYGIPRARIISPTLTYNTEYFSSPPDSWGILWDEDLADQMFMRDYGVGACQIAALYTGQDPYDPDDTDEIQEALEQQFDLNTTLWTDYNQARGNFVNEDVVVGPLLDGQTYLGRFERNNAPIDYTVPKEGTMYGGGHFILPSEAPHIKAATAYTDFATRPENIKQMLPVQGYVPPLPDLKDVYSEELESGELSEEEVEFFQWPDEWWDRLIKSRPLDEDLREEYTGIWTEVKGA
jgi:spermidine/putrescine transport system substrate-binding protein